ncbi:hypothetical protein C7N43_24035 [Sphingobacteriales bacterium UPWRP_1]|nr:hypothetical protein BVG80_12795 [Sphingobacteriales bacterium TSM_CSM]PSJ74425.1 hypothetical protein C7N43_24035 [Sphingobacteriales bacterium UPWRP_1]
MKKLFFLLTVFCVFQLTAKAQTADDALRYSQTGQIGTARSIGAGGAFGALGADFSSLSINPAGIGLYRKSEFTITPSLYFAGTESEYLGTTNTDNRNSFNLNNAGMVLKGGGRRPDSDWRAVNFGFGFNRMNNYNRRTLLTGYNDKNSLLDYYAQQASGTPGNQVRDTYPFDAGLAYFAYLINPETQGNNQYVGVTNGFGVEQQEYITNKRATDEMVLSMGANYKDKLYFGATLGVPFVRFASEKFYSEEDVNDVIQGQAVDLGYYDFNSFELTENVDATGAGINGKLGIIYRPHDMVRIGGAVHTPTLISLNEQYSSSMMSDFADFDTTLYSPEGEYNYQITTPWKLVGSAAFLFKEYGFVSVDYEWADYSQTEFTFDDAPEDRLLASEINREIGNRFTAAHNIRVGAEFAYNILRLRGGYTLTTSPYKNFSDYKQQSLSAGAGFRDRGIFCDVAYVYSFGKNNYYPYTLNGSDVTPATLNNNSGNILLTLGFRL